MADSEAFGLDEPEAADADTSPAQLADDLEAMGPTYVKIGQVLAGRPDLLPEAYIAALARLQDGVKPFPFAEVEEIVMTELGARISKAFSRFDPEPVGGASLGQAHYAELRDGRPVIVKVQRPNIRTQIAEDFEVLGEIAAFFDEHTDMGRRFRFVTLLEEFRLTIQQELNYVREAQNMVAIGGSMREFPLVVVPQPVPDYSSRSVLTMDYIRGDKVTKLSPLARIDLDGGTLADQLLRAYLKQVLVDGLFHADPHPGNVFVTEDHRIALLDLGMVGHTAPGMQENLFKLLLAAIDGRAEEAAGHMIDMSEKLEDFDQADFRRRVSHIISQRHGEGLEQLKIGQMLLDFGRSARTDGLIVPGELVLLGKTLLQLDGVGRILAPDFDPNAAIRRNLDDLLSRRLRNDFTRSNAITSLLELKEFTSNLPVRLNRIMDAITNSELEVKVKSVDARVALDGMQKIANRITAGVVLAALIIGASLLMKVPTSFTLFGYPGLAILLFLAAAAGALYLVGSIFLQDYRSRKNVEK
jgi:predicted unusual protein kinase regulating ubiquinone biosynthesis (AarF/ABC1/UbiB family)